MRVDDAALKLVILHCSGLLRVKKKEREKSSTLMTEHQHGYKQKKKLHRNIFFFYGQTAGL
jgi:hypothetical protein